TSTEKGNKMCRMRILVVVTMAVGLAAPAASAVGATASMSSYTNCTALHKKYPHGLGKTHARDRVRGSTRPVTNFYRSTRLYKIAMSYNSDLDRDRDGVACEQL